MENEGQKRDGYIDFGRTMGRGGLQLIVTGIGAKGDSNSSK